MENKSAIQQEENGKRFQFAFGRINYILMIAGLVILALGYILLSGGGSDDLIIGTGSVLALQPPM